MEGLFLDPQSLPVMGSLILGGLLFLVAFGAVVYGWIGEKPARADAEQPPLKKAACVLDGLPDVDDRGDRSPGRFAFWFASCPEGTRASRAYRTGSEIRGAAPGEPQVRGQGAAAEQHRQPPGTRWRQAGGDQQVGVSIGVRQNRAGREAERRLTKYL